MTYNVIRCWSNWDAIHEKIVASFDNEQDARNCAADKNRIPFACYVVRPAAMGVAESVYFPRGER